MRHLITAVALGLAVSATVATVEVAQADTVLTSSDLGRFGTGKAEKGKIRWQLTRRDGHRVALIRTPLDRTVRYRCLGNAGGDDLVVMKGRLRPGRSQGWLLDGRPARTHTMKCVLLP